MDDEAPTAPSRSNNTPTALPPPSALSMANLEQQVEQMSLLSPTTEASASLEDDQQGTGGSIDTSTGEGDKAPASERKPSDEQLATNVHLPPELLHHILHLAAYTDLPHDFLDPAAQLRRSFLCRAALVCHLWRVESQKLLWRYVQVDSDDGAENFLLSGHKELPTNNLAVGIQPRGGKPLAGALVERIFEVSRGVDILQVGAVEYLGVYAFSAPALKDVKRITFNRLTTFEWSSLNELLPALLPFRLDDLLIQTLWAPGWTCFPLVANLLSVAKKAYLTLLKPGGDGIPLTPPYHPSTPNLTWAPSVFPIETLDLFAESFAESTLFLPYIRRCRRLKTLHLWELDPILVREVPSPLDVLTIDNERDDERMSAILRMMTIGIHAPWPSMVNLKELHVHADYRSPTWGELLAECESRGVRLITSTEQRF